MARGTNEMLRMRNHDVFAFVPKARLNHRSPWLDLAWSIRGFYHPSDFPEALGTPRCRVHVMSTLRGDANMYIGERHKACWLEEGVKRLGRECKKSETYPVWDNHITVMVVHDELWVWYVGNSTRVYAVVRSLFADNCYRPWHQVVSKVDEEIVPAAPILLTLPFWWEVLEYFFLINLTSNLMPRPVGDRRKWLSSKWHHL